ncbi:MAG: hypothetical protein DRQ47_02410, partial [Gammaproteobacteria bacterium]
MNNGIILTTQTEAALNRIKMNEIESTNRVPKFLRKHRVHLAWFLLILTYLYWTMLPEVIFV